MNNKLIHFKENKTILFMCYIMIIPVLLGLGRYGLYEEKNIYNLFLLIVVSIPIEIYIINLITKKIILYTSFFSFSLVYIPIAIYIIKSLDGYTFYFWSTVLCCIFLYSKFFYFGHDKIKRTDFSRGIIINFCCCAVAMYLTINVVNNLSAMMLSNLNKISLELEFGSNFLKNFREIYSIYFLQNAVFKFITIILFGFIYIIMASVERAKRSKSDPSEE